MRVSNAFRCDRRKLLEMLTGSSNDWFSADNTKHMAGWCKQGGWNNSGWNQKLICIWQLGCMLWAIIYLWYLYIKNILKSVENILYRVSQRTLNAHCFNPRLMFHHLFRSLCPYLYLEVSRKVTEVIVRTNLTFQIQNTQQLQIKGFQNKLIKLNYL